MDQFFADHAEVIRELESHQKTSSIRLLRRSVRLRSRKVVELGLANVLGHPEIFKWTAPYDPDFLGYMVGVLPLVYAGKTGMFEG
jgi:hypothetical protein